MEMNKLKGKDFVVNFLSLLEYHKPKLARTEMTGKDGKDLEIRNWTIEPVKPNAGK